MINQRRGVHKINTIIFSISFPQLRVLKELTSESGNYDFFSAAYRVTAIILDIAHCRLFKLVRCGVQLIHKVLHENKIYEQINR